MPVTESPGTEQVFFTPPPSHPPSTHHFALPPPTFCLEINITMTNKCTGYIRWINPSEQPTCKTISPKFFSMAIR
jgi:hypothetical protein